jgi:tetratricopeptide (TPR) repeat protein
MALEAYSPCPCGSGKKFKWCCQPIYLDIDRAFSQDAEGQHEAALRLMDEVVAANPANPEAWGRKAQLLYQNDRADDAETTLQKALEINPRYPFGHLLRGMFRRQEGETAGALLEFRKAAEYYDPEAREPLGQIFTLVTEDELKLNRPVAARAAAKIALHLKPADTELRAFFEEVFGDKSQLPPSARREYTFLGLPADAGETRSAWNQALAGAATGKLSDAARAFEQLTAANASNRAAWYNLGLARAWLGENSAALEALDHYVALEADESRAAEAWTLGEVLRCGDGMEDQADYVQHGVLFQIRDPRGLNTLLRAWDGEQRLVGMQANQEQTLLTGLLLERPTTLTPELAATRVPALAAYFLIVMDRLRLWHTDASRLDQVRSEVQERLGPAVSAPRMERNHVNFNEVLAEALVFPMRISDKEEARRKVQASQERFFEETWIHRPLHSLNRIAPVDAAGHAVLRKKLLGAIRFLEECAVPPEIFTYDFDRLQHKLGLAACPGPASAPAADASRDYSALSAAELAALPVTELADDEVEKAFQAALQLDARELSANFARALVARPPSAGRPDLYPWYMHLVQHALQEGDTQAALDGVNEGEKADCERNEGRRRNDYELRRAQIHAKRGETSDAQGVFERLIARVPSELRYRSTAAEAMLSANQAAVALKLAEQGLAKAREQNDRDSENHFKELVAAAKQMASRG